MILHWMAYAALCAALFGLAAASIDNIVGTWRRARRGVWITAIGVSVFVPLVLPFFLSVERAPSAANPPTVARATTATVTASSINVDMVVLGVWAIASLVFASILLIAHRRTTLALKRCRTGTIGGRAAFVSQDFGPAVVGLLRHHIVVPAWTLVLDDAEQELVVAHELEHARSGDPLLALAGVCAVVAMPWNVALWWQLSRLRLAIELDCDARVIAQRHHDALTYTRLLLSVGERARGTRHPVLAMSRSRSALAKRFDALLGRDVIAPRDAVGLVVLAAGILASVAFVPAPSVLEFVNLVRPTPHFPVLSAPLRAEPVQRSNDESSATAASAKPAAGAVVAREPRVGSARRRATAVTVDVDAVPPVSVVPPDAGRGILDGVVVAQATITPTARPRGGVLMANPSARARGGFAPSRPTGADSNRVIARGAGGGRAVMIARPDTTRPPR